MAQDLYIDSVSNDWYLEDNTTLRLCDTKEELIRQQLYINLLTVQGEWYADSNLGVPYFISIYGKNNKQAIDSVFRREIRSTEGVNSITSFTSEVDNTTRKYTLTFSVLTDEGEITGIEVST